MVAYALIVVGLTLELLGWYGISGKAIVAQQLPYLASASLPGVALVITGAVLAAADRTRRDHERTAQLVATLYELLTEELSPEPHRPGAPAIHHPDAAPTDTRPGTSAATSGTELVALEGGSRYHRAGCALVAGKPSVRSVAATHTADLGLSPCPVCEPPSPDLPG